MKILVTGASGLLGLNLSLKLLETHTVVGVDRNNLRAIPFELVKADLLEIDTCSKLLTKVKPEAVINTAANANIESCEVDPKGSYLINAEFPGRLAALCARYGIRMIHISTDAVFDGTKDGLYTEDDIPNPLSVYAKTKFDGERAVLAGNPEAVVARVNFFGWSLNGERSLSEFFFNRLRANQSCQGFTDVWFCPLFVGHLADILMKIIEKRLSGIYHLVASDSISKYDFGVKIARQFGLDERLIQPISVDEIGLKAKRSHNLRLSVHRLSTALGGDIPGVSTGIRKFHAQYQQGYPQKIRSYQQV